jgi:hypothetical protein
MQSMSSNLPIKVHKDKPHLSQNMCQNMIFLFDIYVYSIYTKNWYWKIANYKIIYRFFFIS